MSKTEAKIAITHATELKPGSRYLIVVDQNSITGEDLHLLVQGLRGMGIENALALSVDGDPTKLVQVVEQPETAPKEV